MHKCGFLIQWEAECFNTARSQADWRCWTLHWESLGVAIGFVCCHCHKRGGTGEFVSTLGRLISSLTLYLFSLRRERGCVPVVLHESLSMYLAQHYWNASPLQVGENITNNSFSSVGLALIWQDFGRGLSDSGKFNKFGRVCCWSHSPINKLSSALCCDLAQK